MKKKGLLMLSTLLLIPSIAKADMGAPDAVRYNVTPNKEGVVCKGYNDDYTLTYGEVYETPAWGNFGADATENKITIIYDSEDECEVSAKDVKGVDILSNTPKIQYSAKVIAKGGLNLRKGPSKSFDKIVTIPQFADIKYGVLDSNDLEAGMTLWIYAEYKGEKGWIFADDNILIELTKPTKIITLESKEVLNKKTNKNIELKAGEEYTVKYKAYSYCNYCDSVYIYNDDLVASTEYLYVTESEVYISFDKDIDLKESFKDNVKDINKQDTLTTIPKNTKVKVLAYNNYSYSAADDYNVFYVEYKGVKGFATQLLIGQDEEPNFNYETYNKNNEKCSFYWTSFTKCLTSKEIDEIENSIYEETQTTENIITEETTNEKQTTTLKEQIEKDNTVILYSIIGVLVGVLTTIIVMLLINNKKSKKQIVVNKEEQETTVEVKEETIEEKIVNEEKDV